MVLVGEVGDEHAQAREMDRARTERFENSGTAPSSSRDADPVVSGTLGESELLHAERHHGREGALRVELPIVDLGEVEEQLRLGCTRLANELPGAGEKVVVVHHCDCQVGLDHTKNDSMPILRRCAGASCARSSARPFPRNVRSAAVL